MMFTRCSSEVEEKTLVSQIQLSEEKERFANKRGKLFGELCEIRETCSKMTSQIFVNMFTIPNMATKMHHFENERNIETSVNIKRYFQRCFVKKMLEYW